MALSSERAPQYARKRLETADIVRDGDFSSTVGLLPVCRLLPRIEGVASGSYFAEAVPGSPGDIQPRLAQAFDQVLIQLFVIPLFQFVARDDSEVGPDLQ
jgi:hypothetical protein